MEHALPPVVWRQIYDLHRSDGFAHTFWLLVHLVAWPVMVILVVFAAIAVAAALLRLRRWCAPKAKPDADEAAAELLSDSS